MSKNYTIKILIVFLLSISQNIFAQTEFCATEILHQQKLASDPNYKANFQEMQLSLQKRIAEKMANDAVSKTENIVYRIPVVFHIIETGEPVSITNNLQNYDIRKAVKTLNENFRAIHSGTDIEIEFALATRSPDCTPTTGINRIDASMITRYVENGINFNGLSEREVKALRYWSNTEYYNVWVVNKIGDGAGGFSAFPGGDPKLDEIVIASQAMAAPAILTHEFGHSFFLYHTFHRAETGNDSSDATDCPLNTDCTRQGDMICDTDPHGRMLLDCLPVNCDRTISKATFENYMSYCRYTDNFTPNQKTRMRASIETSRRELIASLGATPFDSNLPMPACVPTNIGIGSKMGITRFALNELNVVSQGARLEGKNYLDIVCNQEITLDSGSEYPIKVETSLTPHNIKVYVDYNGDGYFTDEGEEITSGNTEEIEGIQTFNSIYKVPYSNIVFNQPLRMRVAASAITDGTATSCEVFKGEAEDYSLTIKKVACTIDAVEIRTQSECNSKTSTYSQSLVISYINQPPTGSLVINGQGFAITESPQTLTLTNLVADGKLVDIIVNFSDDTDCQSVQSGVFTAPSPCISIKSGLSIYPNPTSKEFLYSLNSDIKGEHTIRTFDAIGKLIFEENIIKIEPTLEGIINLEKYAKGMYLLQISNSENTKHIRIVKE